MFGCALTLTPRLLAEEPERHEFILHNFKTEHGVVLPEAHIVFGTYGHLNAAADNAILLPSHYMAELHGYEWLIKSAKAPDQALDTTKLFLITTELFGNGRSSSPSNTPEPFHGPRFPVMTIRDNVNAVHQLLTEELHITHLRAIIGFSMGAQQAFQWAVSYPTFADRVVATSGTAKTYGHGIVRLDGQITALTADAAFDNGDYKAPRRKGWKPSASCGPAGSTPRSGGARSFGGPTIPPAPPFSRSSPASTRTLFPVPTPTI